MRCFAAALALLFATLLPRAGSAEIITLNDLRNCRRIVSLSIKYSWLEDPSSRIFSKHHFVFLEGRYEGYAYSAVKSRQLEDVRKIDNLVIPHGVMEAIAIILKESPLTKIDYVPVAENALRHPHYEISLELCTEGIQFFTVSADNKQRWALSVGKDYYLVGNDAPGSAIQVLEPFMHFEIVTDLKEAAFGKKVAPKKTNREKRIRRTLQKAPPPFKNIFFEYDSYAVTQEFHLTLFGIIDYLRFNPETVVQVAGHCDERGDEAYNIALGEKRASSVISHLITRGASPSQVRAISFGEERPVDARHSEAAWQKNRRVEFYLYDYGEGEPSR
jgi:outer membrane protein OmpA-like peptidoglycan-associated protein